MRVTDSMIKRAMRGMYPCITSEALHRLTQATRLAICETLLVAAFKCGNKQTVYGPHILSAAQVLCGRRCIPVRGNIRKRKSKPSRTAQLAVAAPVPADDAATTAQEATEA